MNITFNNEKNGIEIRFDNKPDSGIIEELKKNGFRWSGKQKMWYAKQTEAAKSFVSVNFKDDCDDNPCDENERREYDLWAMTRTDEIENNFEKYRIYDCKEIASIIRKHLRSRFPMCKWSVTSDRNSIHVSLKSSPWSADSCEIAAIVHYAYKFAESYNYDNSDPMTDYFDVNFYGVYESSILDRYDYEQREMTVSEMNMSKRFAQSKSEWDDAEAERQEKELRDRMAQMEADRIERERIEVEAKANVEKIESKSVVRDADFFVMNCKEPDNRKMSRISDYDDSNYTRTKCRVSRTVDMSKEIYDMFSNLLMRDYSFLSKKGATHTDDLRINSEADFKNMIREERETVEFYSVDCVAIYCDGELKIVVDPQGFDYARYVFFIDEESEIVDHYCGSTGISEEESRKYSDLADDIEGASALIIGKNELFSWDSTEFEFFKRSIIKWIEENNFPFSVKVVRAIKGNEAFKVAMYRVLEEYNGIQEQFRRAALEYDQKITMIRISDFGGVTVTHVKFRSYTNTSYAQHKNAVKLVLRPEKKRQDYYVTLYRDVLIYNGYVDIPEDFLFDVETKTIGDQIVVCKKSKYSSCDRRQYIDVMDYFAAQGEMPVVNTTGCCCSEK